MKFKILIVVGKFYDGAATHLIKGSTSLLDQYKKFETTRDWGPPSILPHFPNESEDTSLRKHAIEYKILNYNIRKQWITFQIITYYKIFV